MQIQSVALWCVSLSLAACSGAHTPGTIRPAAPAESSNVLWEANTQERFGLKPSSKDPAAANSSERTQRLAWDLPKGWVELPATQMRLANFRLDGDNDSECYLSLLPGDGGGLAANINRWRSQLGLEAIDAAAAEALPRALFLSEMATLVDLEGSFSGMGGGEARAGWRMLGLLLVDTRGSAFFKMTGPSATLATRREEFLALAASLRIEDQPSAPAAPTSTAPDKGKEMAGDIPVASADALQWQAPASWRSGPTKPMRAATFLVGPDPAAECYITVLPGESGGLRNNINRWRDQLGQPDLSQEQVDALTRIPMLASSGRLLEIDGVGTAEGKKMLAALSIRPGRSVFVRLTGPKALLESERENFRAFAASIQEKP